jgi:NADPH:quinone reductase-like Zn-dependent oxidoreductase
VLTSLPVPSPAEGEVRVRIHAASVNGFDLAVANGYTKDMMEHRFPVVLGKDFAGVIDAVGPSAEGFAVGDRVFGVVTKPYLGDGSFAEYVTVPVAVGLAHLPSSVDFTTGAALGLAGSAAAGAIAGAALEPGQKVLIAGATGGVGNQAIQLAVKAGAHVIATAASDSERELVTSLGASSTVDYQGEFPIVDVVLHFAGDASVLLAAVRDGGRFVSTLLMSPDQLPSSSVTVVPVYASPSPETLAQLVTANVAVQRVYGLDEAPAALADFAAGTLGKLVIKP